MKKYFVTLSAAICIIFNTSFAALPTAHTITPTMQLQKLTTVIAAIHHFYIRQVDNKELFDSALNGILTKLDPHSSYLNEEALKKLRMSTNGKFEGIGITVIPSNGALKVITPIDNSPAKKAGIKSGDLIVRINKRIVGKLKLRDAIKMMRGKAGTKVTLYVIRKGENKPLKFTITRANIKLKTVRGKLYYGHYGYVRIALFNRKTKPELNAVLRKLQKESNNNLRGLVLDLRNNPGGMLRSSVKVADAFIDARKAIKSGLVVYTKGHPNNKKTNFYASADTIMPKTPMIVLINEGSASAAEIVAGALQDHKRAIVMGVRSFGKGSVQSILPIDKKSALKLTTALYYTPKGRVIQARGIKPDVMIADLTVLKKKTDSVLIDPLKEADLNNHIKNIDADITKIKKQDHELAHTDYQLYEAMNLLKGMNAIK